MSEIIFPNYKCNYVYSYLGSVRCRYNQDRHIHADKYPKCCKLCKLTDEERINALRINKNDNKN